MEVQKNLLEALLLPQGHFPFAGVAKKNNYCLFLPKLPKQLCCKVGRHAALQISGHVAQISLGHQRCLFSWCNSKLPSSDSDEAMSHGSAGSPAWASWNGPLL